MIEKIALQLQRLIAELNFLRAIRNTASNKLVLRMPRRLGTGLITFLLFFAQAQGSTLMVNALVTIPSGAIIAGDGLAIVTWTGGIGPFQVQTRHDFGDGWQDVAGITYNYSQTNILTGPIAFFRVVDVSSIKSKSNDQIAPSTPTGVTATLSSGSQANLNWSASTDPQPKSSGLKGYNIYRNGYFLTQVAAPTTSLSDAGLSPAMIYNYVVSAVDSNYNESAQSAPASVNTDTTAPMVILTSPTGGSTVSGTIYVSATATDNVSVARVDFYRDGNSLVGSSYTTPYGASDNTVDLSNGLHSYSAKVYDAAGNSTTSASSSVTISNSDTTPPAVSLTSPAGGSTVSGIISITASASDNVGVTRVEFYCDGTLIGSDSNSPYTVSDDTTTISNGSHTYNAKAYDAAGNSTASSVINVTVSNNSATLTGTCLWARHFGGTSVTVDKAFTYSVKEDKVENAIAVGCFQGTVNFGNGAITSTNGQEMFIIKYDASGNYLWARQFASTGGNRASAVAVDSSNNIIVVGSFYGNIDFGAGALSSAGNSDIFVAKFSPTGALIWAKRFGGSATEACNAIALDTNDNIFLTGSYGYYGTAIDFGGGPLPLSAGTGAFQSDMYVAKLSSSGNYLWADGYGGLGTDSGTGIAVDGQGNAAVTGSFQQSATFGGTALTSAGGYDMFVAEYSGANGSHLWSSSGGGSADDKANAVAFDGSGNVLVTGYFNGSASIAGNTLSSHYNPGLSAMFLAKYSSTGAALWARAFVPVISFGYAGGNGIAVDGSGNIALTGYACGAVGFDGTYLGNGDSDIFLAKLSATGNTIWAKSYGGTGNDSGMAVSIGAGNNILASGYFYQTADFGTGQMQSSANNDGYIFKTTP